ncbi:hypothetical protein [Levilactobacillus tongjiangensis]|uniref:Uncharacterized protein n=1 Tax=Levilactobacillus tongjiangensis TaxID=2486023 RepID=A0ABW1SRR6_9LACO|nr:hypothetical protein [Levilactobacillus tongjiangensis]
MKNDRLLFQAGLDDDDGAWLDVTPAADTYADPEAYSAILALVIQTMQEKLHLSRADRAAFLKMTLADVDAHGDEDQGPHLLKPSATVKLMVKNIASDQRNTLVIKLADLREVESVGEVTYLTLVNRNISLVPNDEFKSVKNDVNADSLQEYIDDLELTHILYAYQTNQTALDQIIQYAKSHQIYKTSAFDDLDLDAPDSQEEFDRFMNEVFTEMQQGQRKDNVIPFRPREE